MKGFYHHTVKVALKPNWKDQNIKMGELNHKLRMYSENDVARKLLYTFGTPGKGYSICMSHVCIATCKHFPQCR